MNQPRRTYTTRDQTSPQTHTTAAITVVRRLRGGGTLPMPGAEVEIVGAGGKTAGTTSRKGVFKTGLFRAGEYTVRVKKSRYGPPQSGSGVVFPGDVDVVHRFLPNAALPSGVSTNALTVEIMLENPRIHVTVLEQQVMSVAALPGADVEIIGLHKGTSDGHGRFSSHHAPFGTFTVKVGKRGMVSQTQPGPVFFRQVELRVHGTNPGDLEDRDLDLTVVLGPLAPPLPTNVDPSVAIWASGGATPHTVLEDPRLPGDTVKGQGGWDMGINFRTFARLSHALSGAKASHLGGGTIPDHSVRRLAIVAHGAPGVVDVDQHEGGGEFGAPTPLGSRSLTAGRVSQYRSELNRIAMALRQNSVVYLASCQAADGTAGEELLKALSREWPTTTVVGIRTIATTVDGMTPPGVPGGDMFAGVRDTNYSNGANPHKNRQYNKSAFVNDLGKLPWLSESSPHATVARDGNIIRRGDPPSLP